MQLIRSGILFAIFTFIARLFGLVRELLIASLFGIGGVADVVNVGFKLPSLFRRIFAEGAFSIVFIPLFSNKLNRSKEEATYFAGSVFTMMCISLSVVIILMEIFMPQLMWIIAPGFFQIPHQVDLAIFLCRITMPYLLFISIVALIGGILNTARRFIAVSISPIILSGIIIGTTLIFDKYLRSEIIISIALLFGGMLQVVFMLFCLSRANLLFPIIFKNFDYDVKQLLKNMGPSSLGASVQQLNLFISQSIATFVEGAVSILSYAERLYQFPLAIIGISISTVLLPELSTIYQIKDKYLANKMQNNAIKTSLLLSIPAGLGLIVLAHPIIHIIYERGLFSADDTIKTSQTLAIFALGLPTFIIGKILLSIFYANHDTKNPLKITLYYMLINITLNLILMLPLSYIGLALATSIASWFNVYFLYYYAYKYHNFKLEKDIIRFTIKIILSSCFMLVVIFIMNLYLKKYYYHPTILVKTSILFLTILIGILAYCMLVFSFKIYKLK